MYRHLVTLLQHHFSMEDIRIELLADHTANNDSKVYSIQSPSEKYVLKEMLPEDRLKDEDNLVAHLLSKGIKVPKIYLTTSGDATFIHDGFLYILYEFIEGMAFDLNTAPPWALKKSAQTLGQIHSALYDYKKMPLEIDQEAFAAEEYTEEEQYIKDKLTEAKEKDDRLLVAALEERLKHIEKVSHFSFDCDKFTYVNSHGDFYMAQIIVKDDEFVVIDWTQTGRVPACFEVLISYTYAAPECKDGAIDVAMFKPYLNEYLKYAPIPLSSYDLQMMPYLLYHHCALWSFAPPYDDLPREYQQIASLTDNLANQLYHHVDTLAADLTVLA